MVKARARLMPTLFKHIFIGRIALLGGEENRDFARRLDTRFLRGRVSRTGMSPALQVLREALANPAVPTDDHVAGELVDVASACDELPGTPETG